MKTPHGTFSVGSVPSPSWGFLDSRDHGWFAIPWESTVGTKERQDLSSWRKPEGHQTAVKSKFQTGFSCFGACSLAVAYGDLVLLKKRTKAANREKTCLDQDKGESNSRKRMSPSKINHMSWRPPRNLSRAVSLPSDRHVIVLASTMHSLKYSNS